MVRYRGPKNRIARRYGANIFGKARNPLLRKPNPPGMHGARRKKKSDYALQLDEKQKLKACFGMLTEKHMLRAYRQASERKGNTAEFFLQALECRLDNVVYRLKLARSIFDAQQLVAHGHVLVNGKKCSIRSFQVQPGMKVSIKEKMRNKKPVQEALTTSAREVPEHLSLDKESCSGTLLNLPMLESIEAMLPLPIQLPVVCDFLARRL